jgi:putative aldouronate transport system substrate-binding protein
MGITAGAAALASCAKASPTAAPTSTQAPAATATKEPTATPEDALLKPNWDLYTRGDPRYWVAARAAEPVKKYEDLEISQNFVTWGAKFPDGEDIENNATSRFLRDTTGVILKATWSANNPGDHWATSLAAGDIPEYMTEVPGQYFSQLLEADGLADVTDIYEATATPLTKWVRDYPDGSSWLYPKVKGRYMGIATSWGPAVNSSDNLWVRQDWLDKVNMSFPDTVDDVYEVAKAFMGAGLSKFGISVAVAGYAGWGSLSCIFGAFGYLPGQWRLGPDGKLFYSSTDPAQKDALTLLAKWYEDGIIQSDYVKYDADPGIPLNENSVGGNCGIQPAPWWAANYLVGSMKKTFPESEWAFGDVPAGPGGKRGRSGTSGAGMVNAFKKGIDPAKIEAIINQNNFYNDIREASRTGAGPQFEGYDWELDDEGNAVPGPFRTGYMVGGGWEATIQMSPVWLARQYEKQDELLKADPEGKTWNPLEERALADPTGAAPTSRACFLRSLETAETAQFSEFVWTPPTSVTETGAILGPRMLEVYTSIITGKEPVSAWDSWVSEWKQGGGDQMTQDMNQAWEERTS